MNRGLAGALLVLCTCGLPAEPTDSVRRPLIQDAAHGGRAGFYFLPPLVEATTLPPLFDETLTLVAHLDGPAGLIAAFPLVVRPTRQLYVGLLDTKDLGLDPETVYRVRVLSGALELGFGDIKVFTDRREARSLATDTEFELVEDQKLKVEVYVNRCAAVTCDDADVCTTDACAPLTGACVFAPIAGCTGSLEVSADVDEVEATGAELGYQGEVSIAEATVHPGAAPELAGYWPAAGTSGLAVTIGGIVGPWSPRSSRAACAPLAVGEALGTGGQAFADLVQESLDPSGAEVCVDDASLVEIRMARVGPAITPSLASAGGLYRFELVLRAELPDPVFDGERLDLSLLDGTHGPSPLGGALRIARVDGAELVPWYDATLDGAAIFGFLPTAD